MKRLITAVLLMTFISLNAFSQLGDGKFSWSDIVYAMALPFAVFTGCKTEPEPPVIITKNVKVNLTFTLGFDTIDFTPTEYTPVASEDSDWQDHFSATGITYTLTDNLGNSWNSATGFNGTVSIGDGPYANSTTYTFTQTFKMNDAVIGSHTIRVRIAFGNFATLRDENDVTITPPLIPPVSLTLSKQVQP